VVLSLLMLWLGILTAEHGPVHELHHHSEGHVCILNLAFHAADGAGLETPVILPPVTLSPLPPVRGIAAAPPVAPNLLSPPQRGPPMKLTL